MGTAWGQHGDTHGDRLRAAEIWPKKPFLKFSEREKRMAKIFRKRIFATLAGRTSEIFCFEIFFRTISPSRIFQITKFCT